MPRKRDETNGRYTSAYSDGSFIDAIREIDGVATTPKIMDHLGCSQRTALNALHGLEDGGSVSSEKIGNTYVWAIEDDSNDGNEATTTRY